VAVIRYRIHFQWPDGTEDSFIAEGNDDDEVMASAHESLKQRGITDHSNCWSEPLL
jgi:hypothetical protein